MRPSILWLGSLLACSMRPSKPYGKSCRSAFPWCCWAAACQHTFAPGPGLSSNDFGPDSRGAIIRQRLAVGICLRRSRVSQIRRCCYGRRCRRLCHCSAVQRNQNFNDCMMARGWVVADGSASTTDAAMGAKLLPTDQPATAPAIPFIDLQSSRGQRPESAPSFWPATAHQ